MMKRVPVLCTCLLLQCFFFGSVNALEFRQLTDSPAIDRHPSWTPDGQYLVFESNRNGTFDLFRVPAVGGTAEQLTSGPQDERFPEVSPDGTQIAFSWFSVLYGETVGNIYVVPISGSGTWTKVSTSTHFMDFDWHPAWGRDGSTIYFSRRKGSDFYDYALMQAPPVGGATTVFHDAPNGQNRPIPSGDGTKLAFESDEDGTVLNIYETVLAQPGSKRQLTFESANTGAMGYSPDGQTMVFSSRRGTGHFDLYLLNLQDLSFSQLTNDAATFSYDPNNSDAVFSPDGAKIAFTSRRHTGNDNIWIIELAPIVVKEIGIDVDPEHCPNEVSSRSRGILKVAITGTADFDPSLVDPSSLRLEGSLAPDRWEILDTTTPISVACGCPSSASDGHLDLVLRFGNWNTLPLELGQNVLDISGNLLDGTPIHGSDCLTLTGRGGPGQESAILSVDPDGSSVTYSIAEPGRVEMAAYDLSGRRVATLVDLDQPAGQFKARWHSAQVPSGVYFYKLVVGDKSDVRKSVVVH